MYCCIARQKHFFEDEIYKRFLLHTYQQKEPCQHGFFGKIQLLF
jgi:hypothetical protein